MSRSARCRALALLTLITLGACQQYASLPTDPIVGPRPGGDPTTAADTATYATIRLPS